jgi:glycosyltransferase involved in cell wall biosynthesis
LKVAILGTRGVPPNYGGFETFAAELGTRLVKRGHDVTVYCRPHVIPSVSEGAGGAGRADRAAQPPRSLATLGMTSEWNGIHRLVLPAIGHKYLETVSHTFLSALDALKRDFDVILLCNAANAFVLPLLRAARLPVAINVDGIERKRRKWNVLGRAVYALGETMSVSFASAVIADADVIADYYRTNYQIEPVMIPYGADFPEEEDSDVLQRLQLEPRNYILYVSRFEPENNPLEVVKAYEKLEERAADSGQRAGDPLPTAHCPLPTLLMVGKGLYASDLVRELESHASDKIRFPGAIYGRDYRTLQRNALLYIQATEVGGTHPAMIEAMASGGSVLAHGTPENREVGGDSVGYFQLGEGETLSDMLREWLSNPLIREDFRARARRRGRERYSWERVTDEYESLLRKLL